MLASPACMLASWVPIPEPHVSAGSGSSAACQTHGMYMWHSCPPCMQPAHLGGQIGPGQHALQAVQQSVVHGAAVKVQEPRPQVWLLHCCLHGKAG